MKQIVNLYFTEVELNLCIVICTLGNLCKDSSARSVLTVLFRYLNDSSKHESNSLLPT